MTDNLAGCNQSVILTWLWVILLQELSINWHNESITVRVNKAICVIRVDIFYERSFLFGLEFALRLVCHDHLSFDS